MFVFEHVYLYNLYRLQKLKKKKCKISFKILVTKCLWNIIINIIIYNINI